MLGFAAVMCPMHLPPNLDANRAKCGWQWKRLMDLKRLKHLVSLADTGHFGLAAQACHLSQSAFSRSIQSLEAELQLTLFTRGGAQVRCTPAGEFVVQRARKLLFESRCLQRDLALYRDALIGSLAFGVGPFPAATRVPDLLIEINRRFAQVQVRVEVNNARYLLEHLRAEEIDFYLADMRHVPAAADLHIHRLGLLEAGLFVRKGHPLAQGQRVTGVQVLAHGLVSVHAHINVLTQVARSFGLPEGSPLPLALECDDLNLLRTVAQGTDRVLIAPLDALQQPPHRGEWQLLQVDGLPRLGSELGWVALQGRSHSPLSQFALDWLLGTFCTTPATSGVDGCDST